MYKTILLLFLLLASLGQVSLIQAKGLDADVKKSERTYRQTPDGEGALTKEMIEARQRWR